MNLRSPLAFVLLLALFASSAAAQATSWNRRISDIRIVHPPGTPPGTWRAQVDVGVGADGVPSGPLSFDCAIYDGPTVLGVVSLPVEPSNGPTICPGGCSGGCSIAVSFGVPLAGSCSAVGGCHCAMNLTVDVGPFNTPTGTALVIGVTPTVGSLPELDTSDDFFNLVVGENDPGTPTCTGDGTATACPCANNGTTGRGCANSSDATGAHLSATGFVEASSITGTDSVVLHVDGMPSGAPLLYFQGSANPTPFAFGDGVLCTLGTIIRLRVKINVGGASSFPEVGDPSLSVAGGMTPGSGLTSFYQAYYRDAASYCTTATFNVTNGLSLTWY